MAQQMTTLDVLKRAREIASDPSRWTKGAQARDASGEPTGVFCTGPEDRPVCYCSLGFLEAALGSADRWGEDGHNPYKLLAAEIPGSFGTAAVSLYNDYAATTHADVLGLFDRAIAKLAMEQEAGHEG